MNPNLRRVVLTLTTAALLGAAHSLTQTQIQTPAQPPAAPVNAAPPQSPSNAPAMQLDGQGLLLRLDRVPFQLPAARLGKAYQRALLAQGGRLPYRFKLMGNLPAGLELTSAGVITGTPTQSEQAFFSVRLNDETGLTVQQNYALRVTEPGTQAKASTSASTPASAPARAAALRGVDLSKAQTTGENLPPSAIIYRLEQAQLEALKPQNPPPESAPDAVATEPVEQTASAASPSASKAPPRPPGFDWNEAQLAQLGQWLEGLFKQEFPHRQLFEAAVEARLCIYIREIVINEARKLGQTPPSASDLAAHCPKTRADATVAVKSDAKPKPAAAPKAANKSAAAGQVAWPDLAPQLLPPELRRWLTDAARREVLLKPAKPLAWSGGGCGCLREDLRHQVYGFYPAWYAQGETHTIDFSQLSRVSYFALSFSEDLAIDSPDNWTAADTAFIREAKRYGTALDLTIYRRDWRFLLAQPKSEREALVQRLTRQVPQHARDLIDTALPDRASRLKAWMPGFAQVQHMGDGITVYFDETPDPQADPAWAASFEDFYRRFVLGLGKALKDGERPYVLNLVMTHRQLASKGPYDVAALFDLIKDIENPEFVNGRLLEVDGVYKGRSNVELRFVVMLSEPTTTSKKQPRALIESSPELRGGDRRIFLRKTIPVLLLPTGQLQQFEDDLVYAQDNFGGFALWGAPLQGVNIDAAGQRALANVDLPQAHDGLDDTVCAYVCVNRWWFRLAFELLLLVGLVILALLQWDCQWRAKYGRYAPLGGIPTAVIGAALLHCDPALRAVREGNGPLSALLAISLLAALYVLLKPKEDKP